MLWIALIIILLLVIAVVVLPRLLKRKSLPPGAAAKALRDWQAVFAQSDLHRRVLDAEKVLDAILAARGYSGSFADKLRAAGAMLPNTQAVWEAHKLRNRIAHEMHVPLTDRQAEDAVHAFEKALRSQL